MEEYDLAIIGGGPVGGYTAKKIAEKEFKTAIFEEHKNIGKPVKCAGLVTQRIFNFLNIPEKVIVKNQIKGAHIYSPSGHKLTIGGDKNRALVIDRVAFDKEIIKKAQDKGAKLHIEKKVRSVKKQKNHIELKTSANKCFKCKLLIGADGAYSNTRKWFNLPQPAEILKGVGIEITNTSLDPDFVEIYVGKNIAPGFFAWIIPANRHGSKARIGLCINKEATYSANYYLKKFLKNKHIPDNLKNLEINKKTGGAVPLGPLKKTYASNFLIVGDAAAQVKPTSGGGIYTGLLCANHCSQVATEALESNNLGSKFLKKYQKLWFADIGKELKTGMRIRRTLKNLKDKQIDKYIKIFQNTKIIETINKHGDIDYPSKLIKPLLRQTPSLLKLLPEIFK